MDTPSLDSKAVPGSLASAPTSISAEALSQRKPRDAGSMSLTKQKAPAPKKREVKKKPPSPKALRERMAQLDRGQSFAAGDDELEELLHSAGTRMPGKFGDGSLLVRDPADDPAVRFVLKKKQPPKKAVVTSAPSKRSPEVSLHAPSVTLPAKKEVIVARSVVTSIDRRKLTHRRLMEGNGAGDAAWHDFVKQPRVTSQPNSLWDLIVLQAGRESGCSARRRSLTKSILIVWTCMAWRGTRQGRRLLHPLTGCCGRGLRSWSEARKLHDASRWTSVG